MIVEAMIAVRSIFELCCRLREISLWRQQSVPDSPGLF
jgi:hypothetical protein